MYLFVNAAGMFVFVFNTMAVGYLGMYYARVLRYGIQGGPEQRTVTLIML